MKKDTRNGRETYLVIGSIGGTILGGIAGIECASMVNNTKGKLFIATIGAVTGGFLGASSSGFIHEFIDPMK